MFIISNYKHRTPFKISKKNNVYSLESNLEDIRFRATEENSPVNFFFIKKSTNSDVFETSDLKEAKLFIVETIYEKSEKVCEEEEILTRGGYLNLIENFGDKKSKNKIKKTESIKTYKETAVFNIENQILPAFDREATQISDAYSLKLMIKDSTFQHINESELILGDLTAYCLMLHGRINNLTSIDKNNLLALDCFYRALSSERINPSIFESKEYFYNEIKDLLYSGKLPSLAKDKIVAKAYILILMLNQFETSMNDLPNFGMNSSKIISILKIIGCNITGGSKITLKEFPRDFFTIKKIKR